MEDPFGGIFSARWLMSLEFDKAEKCLEEAVKSMKAEKTDDACRMAVAALEALGWNVTVTRRE